MKLNSIAKTSPVQLTLNILPWNWKTQNEDDTGNVYSKILNNEKEFQENETEKQGFNFAGTLKPSPSAPLQIRTQYSRALGEAKRIRTVLREDFMNQIRTPGQPASANTLWKARKHFLEVSHWLRSTDTSEVWLYLADSSVQAENKHTRILVKTAVPWF